MAELSTLARPYAKAAFECAFAAGTLAQWSLAMEQLAGTAESGEFVAIVSSPSKTAEQKSQAFVEVCAEVLDAQQQNFVRVLSENDRLSLLPSIRELFELYKANQEKSVDVSIESAFELTPKQLESLELSLKKTLARDIEFKASTNKELIGGVFIRAGDNVIDASIRGRLAQLANAMNA